MTLEAERALDARHLRHAHLERLAAELARRGLTARIVAPPGRIPSLHVVNPAASAMAEDVYAGCGKDGIWWFWWSWAERIAVSDDVALTATKIERVLAPAPQP
jgi:hypothetical protein